MPILPSGRQVELSTDRFMAFMPTMDLASATRLFHSLQSPDDLLFIADVVYLDAQDEAPRFADFVAADWETHSQDWPEIDRVAFKTWLASEDARKGRVAALTVIRDAMEETDFAA